MPRQVIFLTESGPRTGLGHLRRCQMLAIALDRRGWRTGLLLPDPAAVALPDLLGFATAAWPADLAALPAADALVIDSYRIDSTRYADEWRQRFGAVLVVDDLADRPIAADLVLNHNIHAEASAYRELTDARLLVGLSHALIDPAFFALAGRPRPAPRVLVSFGGTDDGSLSQPLVAKALAAGIPTVDWVLPTTRTLPPAAQAFLDSVPAGLNTHRGARLIDLMGLASSYLGGAGVTALEAAAAGLALTLVTIAENQSAAGASFTRHGVPVFSSIDDPAIIGALTSARRISIPELRQGGPDKVAEHLIAACRKQD